MRSRAGVAALIACIAAGALALVLVAGSDKRTLAFTIDVRALAVLVAQPGHELCQRGIDREAGFDTVELHYGTFGRPGPRMGIAILDSRTRRPLATGVVPAGHPDNSPADARISPALPAGAPIDACARNLGAARVGLYGGPASDSAATAPSLGRNGPQTGGDLSVTFLRSHPRSVLSQVPAIFERASIFRPGWVGAWTFWALLGAVGLAVPALLARALAAAARESD